MAQTLEHNSAVTSVSAVSLPKFDGDVSNIQKLDDEPNDVGGLTAAELKARFDKGNEDIVGFINDTLIPAVLAQDSTEEARQLAEGERVANEQERVKNEDLRVRNENARNMWEAFDSTKSYDVGNKVSYEGSSYVCIAPSFGVAPTNSAYWLLIAAKGADGTGVGDMLASVYDPQGKASDIFAANNATRSMLAPVETTSTASRSYTAGDLLIYDGVLREVTADIAEGETIEAGSNISADKVTLSEKVTQQLAAKADLVGGKVPLEQLPDDIGGLLPQAVVTTDAGASVTATLDDTTVGPVVAGEDGVATLDLPSFGTWTLTAALNGESSSATLAVTEVRQYAVTISFVVAFAFHYTENDSNPDSVTYPAGYTNSNWNDPFYVDLTTGVPHWGDWAADVAKFLIPRSCMLKFDGTRDYYLNENDESLKEDGTASDYNNTSYGGNAMMEWGQKGAKIYWKIVPDADGKGWTFVTANKKLDADMDAWNHYNCKGQLAEHFYTPKYFGSDDGTRLRSISGGTNYVNHTPSDELTKAKANNQTGDEIWNTEVYCDWLLVQMLCMLFTKSTNGQEKFGYGFANGNSAAIGQGTMNGKGLFWGESTGKYGVKIFGMENPFGNIWRRIAGLINDKGTVKIKLTYGKQDGSTVEGYNLDGSGYITHGTTGNGSSEGYISHMNITNRGITPNTMSGSDSTLYCDACWVNNNQVDYAFVGGNRSIALPVGLFCVHLDYLASDTLANLGASLSCKPLAT